MHNNSICSSDVRSTVCSVHTVCETQCLETVMYLIKVKSSTKFKLRSTRVLVLVKRSAYSNIHLEISFPVFIYCRNLQ